MTPDPKLTLTMLFVFAGLTGAVCTVLTLVITQLITVFRMKGKYNTLASAQTCRQERQAAENCLIKVLRRMEKRILLGNIIIRDLVEADNSIPNDKIEKYEKDLGISLTDRDFGIPE